MEEIIGSKWNVPPGRVLRTGDTELLPAQPRVMSPKRPAVRDLLQTRAIDRSLQKGLAVRSAKRR